MPRILFHLGAMARVTVVDKGTAVTVRVWRPVPTVNVFRAMYAAIARRERRGRA